MADYENLSSNAPDGSQWGKSASEKIACYGAVPVIQRAYSSAVHATAGIASSTAFGSDNYAATVAAVQEIQNTLIGLGIWATA